MNKVLVVVSVLFAVVFVAPAAHAIVSDRVAEDLTTQITQRTSVVMRCGQQELPSSSATTKLSDPAACEIEVKWAKSVAVDDVAATPKKMVIIKKGSVSPTDYIFECPLTRTGDSRRIFQPQEWFRPDKFTYGEEYRVWVVYGETQTKAPTQAMPNPLPEQLDDQLVPVYLFKPIKSRLSFQLTGKVFTAWQLSGTDDRSFVVPGIAAGLGVRVAGDYNDQDVIGLRAVFAAGPNLVPKITTTTDMTGNTTTTSSPQKLNGLLGLELVGARYVSIGLMWSVLGSDRSLAPLFLLSYGELYPSVISTK